MPLLCRHAVLAPVLILLALLPPARAAAGGAAFYLKDAGKRVVFLGDSNTFAGLYVAYLDGYLRTRFPDRRWELINLGLPSETVSGLSEPDHPYPRPDVHTRLERALDRTKPDVVVVCYGMNDGIYSPFAEERFARYRAGVEKLVARAEKAGAKVVLMTPAPFDPLPVRKRLLPAGAPKYSWMRPYEDYDDVLGRYSEWLLTWRKRDYPVADAHGALRRFVKEVRREEPNYTLSGDGIHPSATGHALIALELLRTWNAPPVADHVEIDAAKGKVLRDDVSDFKGTEAGLRFTWKARLPLPVDARWDQRLQSLADFNERVNQYRLTVKGLPGEHYELWEGDKKVGTAARTDLERGLDLTRLRDLSTNRRAAEASQLLQKRERLLGLAWLDEVGHKRPDTPKGLPLAETRKQAEALDARVRALLEVRAVALELRRK